MGLFGPPDVEKLEAKRDVPGLIKALGYEKDSAVRQAAAAALGNIGAAGSVEHLIAALTDKHVRPFAARALGQIRDARAVQPLLGALKDGDASVRRVAIDALGQIRDARCVEPLVAALEDSDEGARLAAAGALVQIGSPAVRPLAAALEAGTESVRKAAARTLGRIGDAGAVPALVRALRDPRLDVRQAAAKVLDELSWKPDRGEAGSAYWVIRGNWGACIEIGAPAVGPLIDALRDQNDWSAGAARTLGKIGGARAVEALTAALEDGRADVREAATAALGEAGRAGAGQPLAAQKAAAPVPGPVGDAPTVASLIAALRDRDASVREAAIQALARMGVPAVEPLAATLKNQDKEMRRSAAEALHRLSWSPDRGETGAAYWAARGEWDRCVEIGAPAVVPLIMALKDGYVRSAAVRALGQLGDARAVHPLAAALEDPNQALRSAAARALGQIGDARGAAPLVASLKDQDKDVRKTASEALVQIGAPAVVPLTAALKDRDKDLRGTAAEVLDALAWSPDSGESGAAYWAIRCEWDKCVEIGAPAVAALAIALKDPVNDVRLAAVGALGRIGTPAVTALAVALTDPVDGVRLAAVGALGQIGAPAISPLTVALRDLDPDVRQAAEKALVQIGAPAASSLIAAIQDRKDGVRSAAARALGQIGGGRAIDPLIAALRDPVGAVRRAAASALVDAYRSGKLDETRRVQILAQRDVITTAHTDRDHNDQTTYQTVVGGSSDCGTHNDYEAVDRGIGVDFPV